MTSRAALLFSASACAFAIGCGSGVEAGSGSSDPNAVGDRGLASDPGVASDLGAGSDNAGAAGAIVVCHAKDDPICTRGAVCAIDDSPPPSAPRASLGLCVQLCLPDSTEPFGAGSPTGCAHGARCVRLQSNGAPQGVCLLPCTIVSECPRAPGFAVQCRSLYRSGPSKSPVSHDAFCDYGPSSDGAAPASSGTSG